MADNPLRLWNCNRTQKDKITRLLHQIVILVRNLMNQQKSIVTQITAQMAHCPQNLTMNVKRGTEKAEVTNLLQFMPLLQW